MITIEYYMDFNCFVFGTKGQLMDLKHIDAKLDKIDDRLNKIDVHLATYNEQLKYHIKRTDMLEVELKPVAKHVQQMRGVGKALGIGALVATIVGGVTAIIALFRQFVDYKKLAQKVLDAHKEQTMGQKWDQYIDQLNQQNEHGAGLNWDKAGFEKLQELAGRPQQMITVPIDALQHGASPVEAIGGIGAAFQGTADKKSFSDIADNLREKYNVQHPAALGALATAGALGDVFVDPAMAANGEMKAEKLLAGTIDDAAKAKKMPIAVHTKPVNAWDMEGKTNVFKKDTEKAEQAAIDAADKLSTDIAAGERTRFAKSIDAAKQFRVRQIIENLKNKVK